MRHCVTGRSRRPPTTCVSPLTCSPGCTREVAISSLVRRGTLTSGSPHDRTPMPTQRQVPAATHNLRVAADLLAWLHERGGDLLTCAQGDLDEWFTTRPNTHAHTTAFVRWAITTGRCPKLALPARRSATAPVLDQAARLDILRQLLDPSTGRLDHRVAAMLLVLVAQPFTRIAALKVDDIII